MVKVKNTVRCISFKANFKPARNILNLEAILYCTLVYLVPGIKSRALWWQNVYTFKKQAQCDRSTEWQSVFTDIQIASLYVCMDMISHLKSTSTKTRRPVPSPYSLKKLTLKGRVHQIHCFQVMFR